MSDNSFAINPSDCVGVIFGAEQQVYAGTGYEAIRDQTLGMGTSSIDNMVEQTVVVSQQMNKRERYWHPQPHSGVNAAAATLTPTRGYRRNISRPTRLTKMPGTKRVGAGTSPMSWSAPT